MLIYSSSLNQCTSRAFYKEKEKALSILYKFVSKLKNSSGRRT